MSLRSRIVLILASVVSLYLIGDHLVQRLFVSRGVAQLEEIVASRTVSRVHASIQDEVERLSKHKLDLAIFAGPYAGVQPKSLPAPGQLAWGTGLDLLYICSADGSVLWSRIEERATGEAIELRGFPREKLSSGHRLFASAHTKRPGAGVMRTERGPLLVNSRWIEGPEEGLPDGGVVLLGRFLDEPMLSGIRRQLQLDFSMVPFDDLAADPEVSATAELLSMASEPILATRGEGTTQAFMSLPDERGIPKYVLSVPVDRSTSSDMIRYAAVSSLSTALLIMYLLTALLRRIVIGPVMRLTQHATLIGRTDDLDRKINMNRADEVGQLADEFDSMMDKLAEARSDHAHSARLAGMSEIAMGVLHNVGNSLNSVNVSVGLIDDHLHRMSGKDLEGVLRVLDEHSGNLEEFLRGDPRGQHLIPFLREISRTHGEVLERLKGEFKSLTGGVEDALALVRSQQSLVGSGALNEHVEVNDLVDYALDQVSRAVPNYHSIEIVTEYGQLSLVDTDRRRTSQILINLVLNASQALLDAEIEKPRICLRTGQVGEEIFVEVEDNGPGIEAAHLQRVFSNGFTTKVKGNGFGLHASANSATEMGGSLQAFSDGPGHGATFRLVLPCSRPTEEELGAAA